MCSVTLLAIKNSECEGEEINKANRACDCGPFVFTNVNRKQIIYFVLTPMDGDIKQATGNGNLEI